MNSLLRVLGVGILSNLVLFQWFSQSCLMVVLADSSSFPISSTPPPPPHHHHHHVSLDDSTVVESQIKSQSQQELQEQQESTLNEATTTTTTTNTTTTVATTTIEEWRNQLPLELQKRTTLHRFFLPSSPFSHESSSSPPCEVFLLGTSHISASSCSDVQLLMNYARPDCLFLELCPQRIPILEPPPPTPQPQIPSSSSLESESESESESDKTDSQKSGWFPSPSFLKSKVFSQTKTQRQQPQPPKSKKSEPSLLEQIQTLQAQSPEMSKSSALSSILLSQIQSDYAEKLNITVGAEFREAFEMATKQQQQQLQHPQQHSAYAPAHAHAPACRVILGDRPVKLTLLRTWESLHFLAKVKLVLGLIWGCLPFNQPSDQELKEWMESILKDGGDDVLTKSMKELSKHFPTILQTIIQERDLFMYAKLNQVAHLGARRIVAIVGAGHCPGICSLVEKQQQELQHLQQQQQELQQQQQQHSPLQNQGLDKHYFENILKDIVETNKFKITNEEGKDIEEMKTLLTDVVELSYQPPPPPTPPPLVAARNMLRSEFLPPGLA